MQHDQFRTRPIADIQAEIDQLTELAAANPDRAKAAEFSLRVLKDELSERTKADPTAQAKTMAAQIADEIMVTELGKLQASIEELKNAEK